jgi:hypothetical protein
MLRDVKAKCGSTFLGISTLALTELRMIPGLNVIPF